LLLYHVYHIYAREENALEEEFSQNFEDSIDDDQQQQQWQQLHHHREKNNHHRSDQQQEVRDNFAFIELRKSRVG